MRDADGGGNQHGRSQHAKHFLAPCQFPVPSLQFPEGSQLGPTGNWELATGNLLPVFTDSVSARYPARWRPDRRQPRRLLRASGCRPDAEVAAIDSSSSRSRRSARLPQMSLISAVGPVDVQRDRLRHPVDRQIAEHLQLARADHGDAARLERDLRILRDVEEQVAPQILVAIGIARVDRARIDRRLDPERRRDPSGRRSPYRPGRRTPLHIRHNHVPDRKGRRRMPRIDRPSGRLRNRDSGQSGNDQGKGWTVHVSARISTESVVR